MFNTETHVKVAGLKKKNPMSNQANIKIFIFIPKYTQKYLQETHVK